jgi:cyclic pyranopterin phosphate synthase
MRMQQFTHIDKEGKARMVNVAGKRKLLRTASAEGRIKMAPATAARIRSGDIEKGDVLPAARIAGITGGKRTSELIPLCHGLALDSLSVDLQPGEDEVYIRAEAVAYERTGVEMEALTAVTVAALTVYDMCKAVDKGMRIEGVRLIEKRKEQLPQRSTEEE